MVLTAAAGRATRRRAARIKDFIGAIVHRLRGCPHAPPPKAGLDVGQPERSGRSTAAGADAS
jgi:hypothetical protein